MKKTHNVIDELVALRKENEKLRQELVRDHLTGLFNAQYLQRRLEDGIANLANKGEEAALIFIDVDCFKGVNEEHGHLAASRVLAQLGRLIQNLIRIDDLAFRFGGDEFVVLVMGNRQRSLQVGERLRAAIEEHSFRVLGIRGLAKIKITVSMGVRVIAPEDTASQIIQDADRAMFEAKRISRNTVVAA